MKQIRSLQSCIAAAVFLKVLAVTAEAQTNADILAFGGGYIVWTNANTALYYNVEWVPAMTGANWTGSYRGLQDLRSSSPIMTAAVPMFFRVMGSSNAVYTKTLSSTTTVVEAGYYHATNLAQVDIDLAAANIRTNITIFGISGNWITNQSGGAYSNASCSTAVTLGAITDNSAVGLIEVSAILQGITPGTSRWYHVTSEDPPGDAWKTIVKIYNISTNMNVDLYVYRRLKNNTCATSPAVAPQMAGNCNTNYPTCQNRDACSLNASNTSECVYWYETCTGFLEDDASEIWVEVRHAGGTSGTFDIKIRNNGNNDSFNCSNF